MPAGGSPKKSRGDHQMALGESCFHLQPERPKRAVPRRALKRAVGEGWAGLCRDPVRRVHAELGGEVSGSEGRRNKLLSEAAQPRTGGVGRACGVLWEEVDGVRGGVAPGCSLSPCAGGDIAGCGRISPRQRLGSLC